MFALLTYPLALFTALGIVLPILIHLWNRKSRKILVVGSISPLQEGKKQQLRKWHIQYWPLFLVRCALLLCLSFFLSAPKLRQNETREGARAWVLLGKGYAEHLSKRQQQQVDSLQRAGYELRSFTAGFPRIKKQGDDVPGEEDDYFSLLRELNGRLPSDFPVFLFAQAKQSHLLSTPPKLAIRLNWETFDEVDKSSVSWVQRAWKTEDDSIRALVTFSSSADTHSAITVVQGDGKQQGLSLEVENGTIKLKSTSQTAWVAVEEKPLEVQLLADGGAVDPVYVKAFMEAFSDYTSFPIVVKNYQADQACDLLFDLRPGRKQTQEFKQAKTIFRYAGGKEEKVLHNNILLAHYGGNTAWPDLYQRVPNNDSARAVWTDAYKRPILTLVEKDGDVYFTFYSRFHPQWTSLVWSPKLVDYLLPIVFPESGLLGISAERVGIQDDPSAFQGRMKLPVSSAEVSKPVSWKTMQGYFLWLALLLFALERVLSYQRGKGVADGKLGR